MRFCTRARSAPRSWPRRRRRPTAPARVAPPPSQHSRSSDRRPSRSWWSRTASWRTTSTQRSPMNTTPGGTPSGVRGDTECSMVTTLSPRYFNTLNTFVTRPFHNSMSMTGAGTVSRRARIQHLPSSLTLRDRLGWFLQAKTFFQTSTQHTRKWEFKARHRDLSLMFTINESFCKQDGGEVQALEEAMHQPFLKKKLKTRGLSRSNSSYTRYGNSLLFMNITSVYHGIPVKSLK